MTDKGCITISNRMGYYNVPCVRFDNLTGITFYKTIGAKASNYKYYTIELDTNNNIIYFNFTNDLCIGCFKLTKVGFSIKGATVAWKKFGIKEGAYKAEWVTETRLAVNLNEKISD
ncbi:MAG: hypothetical protein QXS29_09740 [Nitrososphaeria archaeon]